MPFIREPGLPNPKLDPLTVAIRIANTAIRINDRLLAERTGQKKRKSSHKEKGG